MPWSGGSAYSLPIWNLACSRPQHPRPFDQPGILLSWPFTLPQGSSSRHRSCHPPYRREHGGFGTSSRGVVLPFSALSSKNRLPGIRSTTQPANGRRTRHAAIRYPGVAKPERRFSTLPPPHLPNSRRIDRCMCGGGGSLVPRPAGGSPARSSRKLPSDDPLSPGSTRPLVHPGPNLAEARALVGREPGNHRPPEGGRSSRAIQLVGLLRRAGCPSSRTGVRGSRHPGGCGSPLAPHWSGRSISWLFSRPTSRRRTIFPAAPKSQVRSSVVG